MVNIDPVGSPKFALLAFLAGGTGFRHSSGPSGLLGAGCSKYLPISNITDLRLELAIENAIQAVVQGTGTASFTLHNIQLIAAPIRLLILLAKRGDFPLRMPPLYLDPPQRVNGLGHVSLEQLKKERHAKAFRDHQDAMQTHNRIRETRENLLDTMGVGVPNMYFKRINNPKM